MSNWIVEDQSTPLVIAHRGASGDAPENTLVAFQLAEAQQADGFEFDVHLSADGVPVVIHDRKLERTTTGTGLVSSLTVSQLKELDAGEGESIPTLEEVFSTFGERMLYNIELKGFYFHSNQLEQTVADLMRRHNLAHCVTVSSFSFLNMHRYRAVGDEATLMGMIRYPSPQALSHYIFRGNVDHPHFSMVDVAYMDWAVNKKGMRVHVWTVNEPQEGKRLIELGVHGIMTDHPKRMREALGL
ncbi:MAG: glycerophosphodiester phosphodiesterase family protein [Chloroflexota bacterium]